MLPVPTSARIYTNNVIKIPIEITIRNTGNKTTAPYFFYVYLNQTNTRSNATKYFPSLGAGQTKTFQLLLSISDRYNASRINLNATIDPCDTSDDIFPCPRGNVMEKNENNNKRNAWITLPRYRKVGRPFLNG